MIDVKMTSIPFRAKEADVPRKKAIEVIAIATCGVSFALLSAFVIAILSANGLMIEFKPTTGKERSVALSIGKDSDPIQSWRPLSGEQTSASLRTG